MGNFDYSAIPVGYYDEVYRRHRGVQSRWHHDKFGFFRQCIREGESHLDIGCGPGTFIATLPTTVASTGVDIAGEQVEYAKRVNARGGANFQQIATGPLPFPDESFDVVTAIELVEHLTPDENARLIGEIFRVLRTGGRALVSTPNYASMWPVVEALVNRLGDVSYEEQHITRLNARTLRQALEAAPWKRLEIRAYQFLAPFAAALGWSAADFLARAEPEFIVRRQGMLLFAEATK